jgi:hypothetical protein
MSSYLTGNMFHLLYKDQLVNAVYGNNRSLMCEQSETHRCTR